MTQHTKKPKMSNAKDTLVSRSHPRREEYQGRSLIIFCNGLCNHDHWNVRLKNAKRI